MIGRTAREHLQAARHRPSRPTRSARRTRHGARWWTAKGFSAVVAIADRSARRLRVGGSAGFRQGRRPWARPAGACPRRCRASTAAPEKMPGTVTTSSSQPPCPPVAMCPWSATITNVVVSAWSAADQPSDVGVDLAGDLAVLGRTRRRTSGRPRRGREGAPPAAAGRSPWRCAARRPRASPTGSRPRATALARSPGPALTP